MPARSCSRLARAASVSRWMRPHRSSSQLADSTVGIVADDHIAGTLPAGGGAVSDLRQALCARGVTRAANSSTRDVAMRRSRFASQSFADQQRPAPGRRSGATTPASLPVVAPASMPRPARSGTTPAPGPSAGRSRGQAHSRCSCTRASPRQGTQRRNDGDAPRGATRRPGRRHRLQSPHACAGISHDPHTDAGLGDDFILVIDEPLQVERIQAQALRGRRERHGRQHALWITRPGRHITDDAIKPLSRNGARCTTSDSVRRPTNSIGSSSARPSCSALRMKRLTVMTPSRYAPSL